MLFFFNDTATTEIYTLSLHDALPILLRRASVVLCNSKDTLIRCSALTGSAARMCVVHLGAEAPHDPPAKRSEPALVTLGHIVARKRHVDVLHALTVLAARIPDVRWVVIGDGPERAGLQRLAG